MMNRRPGLGSPILFNGTNLTQQSYYCNGLNTGRDANSNGQVENTLAIKSATKRGVHHGIHSPYSPCFDSTHNNHVCQVPIYVSSKCHYMMALPNFFSWEDLLKAFNDIPCLSYAPEDCILVYTKEKDKIPLVADFLPCGPGTQPGQNKKKKKTVHGLSSSLVDVKEDVELNHETIELLRRCDPLFYLNGYMWLLRNQQGGHYTQYTLQVSVDLSAFALRANKMINQGRYADALSCYQSMLDESPNNPNLHVDQADCLCLLQKYDDAEKAYLEAIKADENCFRAYMHYAYLLKFLEKIDFAQSYYEKGFSVIDRIINQSNLKPRSSISDFKHQQDNLWLHTSHHYFKKTQELEKHKIQHYQKLFNDLQCKEEEISILKKEMASMQQNFEKKMFEFEKDHQNAIVQLKQEISHLEHTFQEEKQQWLHRTQNTTSVDLVCKANTTSDGDKDKRKDKWENKLDKKNQSESANNSLKNSRDLLLQVHQMKLLNKVADLQAKQQMMIEKVKLCQVSCDFTSNATDEKQRIYNKRELLLDVVQEMSSCKWNSSELLLVCLSAIRANLFRTLPDGKSTPAAQKSEEEQEFRDPAWFVRREGTERKKNMEHLQLVYELAFHVVTNTNVEKKALKKYLQGAFLQQLILLFSSPDRREPQYVKILVHAIYGRFMALRKAVRRHLCNYCYKYIYESVQSRPTWQGLPEVLEIFSSIFQGLNVPVKGDYQSLIQKVIVPLHKTFHLVEFHDQLFWPKFNPAKEQLFIQEIIHVVGICTKDSKFVASAEFNAVVTATLDQLLRCAMSPHHQIAERSLSVWREEPIQTFVDSNKEVFWPKIINVLQHNCEQHWLSTIRNLNRQILNDFQFRNSDWFLRFQSQASKTFVPNNGHYTDPSPAILSSSNVCQSAHSTDQQKRRQKWEIIRQMANLSSD
ncbi:protein phosphatase 2a, regulatory subunit [Reticulomyxa filosa]|uniref:Protein phosphatase 2a, regulatory subunit n=1 Tax=Reticulomyxa filosa TaxID=46433 RepID=X6NCY2_RETFI|nr:protein phosphatase 2a, regulatory subunit [Reticulomyxa filosa]|eukprot:ETO23629.1 protein phosphatase 2a, regulatory subunit [Reticulomyxa filosa]